MQPLNLQLSIPVNDSCTDCTCCFPMFKKKKDKTAKVAEAHFEKDVEVKAEPQTKRHSVSKVSESDF